MVPFQVPYTQMYPCKDAFLSEDRTKAQTVRVTTLQTSFCHSSRGVYKRIAVLKERDEECLIAAVISQRTWVNLKMEMKLFLKALLLVAEILVVYIEE